MAAVLPAGFETLRLQDSSRDVTDQNELYRHIPDLSYGFLVLARPELQSFVVRFIDDLDTSSCVSCYYGGP